MSHYYTADDSANHHPALFAVGGKMNPENAELLSPFGFLTSQHEESDMFVGGDTWLDAQPSSPTYFFSHTPLHPPPSIPVTPLVDSFLHPFSPIGDHQLEPAAQTVNMPLPHHSQSLLARAEMTSGPDEGPPMESQTRMQLPSHYAAAYAKAESILQAPQIQAQVQPHMHMQHSLSPTKQPAPSQSPQPLSTFKQSSSLNINNVWTSHGRATSSLHYDGPHVAARACISCRRLKAACDNGRPCARCVRAGRPCLDRTDAEIKQARTRKKRKDNETETVKSGEIPMAALKEDREAADRLSKQLFSRSCLAVFIQEDVRNTILRVHAQLDSLPLELGQLLEFHAQSNMFCLLLSNLLTEDDFDSFLTHGLSADEMNSPLFLSSPLQAWTRLTTRPLFATTHPLPPQANLDAALCAPPEAPEGEQLQVRIEWLPRANANYQRWQRMLITKIIFERELRTGRERGEAAVPISRSRPVLGLGSGNSHSSSLSGSGSTPDDPSCVSAQLADAPSPSAITESAATVPSASPPNDVAMANETDALTHAFTLIDLSPALAAPPTAEREHEVVHQSLHAIWCPVSKQNLEEENNTDIESVASFKVKRESGMQSVHPMPVDNTCLPNASCICALSTLLPQHLYLSPAFEREFGWRRVDAEKEFQKDGWMWFRQLSTPTSWLPFHLKLARHWKEQIAYVGHMAMLAAHVTAGAPLPSNHVELPEPRPLTPHFDTVRTRAGEMKPSLYRRTLSVHTSDGDQKHSAFVFAWTPTDIPAGKFVEVEELAQVQAVAATAPSPTHRNG